jgi:hypothetical protein
MNLAETITEGLESARKNGRVLGIVEVESLLWRKARERGFNNDVFEFLKSLTPDLHDLKLDVVA